jgi:hypothetical protein
MLAHALAVCVLPALTSLDAHAWETDQLTDRAVPPADVTEAANARVDALVADAIVRTNRQLRCRATPERTQEVLGREIRQATSRDTPVRGRGFLRSLGYGALSAWLETAALPRRSFPERDDVFGGIPGSAAPILSSAGTSSTVRIGGVLLGTDKPDHFFETGWRYHLRSTPGRPDRAVAWGTWTENTFLGLMTSSGFSYADLVANWQGRRYYETLLDPVRGDFELGPSGCVRARRGFDFRRWVDWRWDELANPTVYTRKVTAWLSDHLDAHRAAYCRDAPLWIDEVRRHRAEMLAEGPGSPWASAEAPPRQDVFDLERRCAPELAAPVVTDAR